jgi:hypothetical protein
MTSLKSIRRSHLAAVSFAVCGLAIGVSGLATAGPGPDEVKATSPDLPGLVAAFARVQQAADRFEPQTVESILAYDDLRPGEQPALSRRLGGAAGPIHAWPFANGVCHSTLTGSACYPTSLLRERGVLLAASTSSESPQVHVRGLAAKGIQTVTFHMGEGAPIEVPVEDSAVSVTLPTDAVRVTWRGADGREGGQGEVVPGDA